MNREDMLLYAVTDSRWTCEGGLVADVEEAIKGGVTFVQYREKNLPYEEAVAEAVKVKKVCNRYGVPFVINDSIDMALEVGADGVHLGQDDIQDGDVREKLGASRILGITAKNLEQAVAAEKMGADYLGVGAVFQSGAKSEAKRITHETLREICGAVDIPVVAIGGITAENVRELKGAGMAGVAVVSAIFAQESIEEAAGKLRDILEETV